MTNLTQALTQAAEEYALEQVNLALDAYVKLMKEVGE